MTVDVRDEQSGGAPVPGELWVVAWASLASQLVHLTQGVRTRDELSLLVSTVLGGLLVGYVAAGVVRARTVRLVLAWVVLGLSALFQLVALVLSPGAEDFLVTLLMLVTSVVSLVALARYRRTPWYAWQRSRPPASEGAPIGPLVAVGVLVGVLGGVVGPTDDSDLEVRVSVEGR